MAMPSPPELTSDLPPASEIAIQYLFYHLDSYNARKEHFEALRKEPNTAFTPVRGVPNLQQAAAAQVVKSLREDSVGGIEKMLIDSVPTHLWDSIMHDPRVHYSSFRRMNTRKVKEDGGMEGDEVDVWIQRNEKWLRVDGTNWGLVTLDDAKAIFPTATHTATEIIIPRRQPPSSSFCFLDEKRPSSLSILPSNEIFIETLNRVTNNCLKGLDWDNLFLAGGMALNALLCTNPAMENSFPDSDLDLYIYGLSPNQANEKVNQIYKVWCMNVGARSVEAGLCIKNSKTINFLGMFPDRRIQIVLRITKTPAEVLLNFDLDPCAIGFDGRRVLMLPRAARALETGYTSFTSFLIYGHHLGERHASQEMRCFKYAWRGFGIRILSCYMKDLTLDPENRLEQESAVRSHRALTNSRRDEGPGVLKGLKAIKRVAFSAEDMVRRFVLNEVNGEVRDAGEFDYRQWVQGPNGAVPRCSFRTLDALKQHIGRPNGRVGIGSFELFFRHCAAWKLEREGRIEINYDDFANMYNTGGTYDELPSFSWDEDFRPENIMADIDTYNKNITGLFDHFKDSSADRWEWCNLNKVGITEARMVYAKTLQGIMDQQLAIPIIISWDLEDQLTQLYDGAAKESGIDDSLFYHNVNRDDGVMMRLWLIGKQTMWARIDRKIDEIFELLWPFFHLQQLTPERISGIGATNEDEFEGRMFTELLREHLERRVHRPMHSNTGQQGGSIKDNKSPFQWPSEEEKELFDFWVRQYPRTVFRGDEAPFCSTAVFDEQENFKEPEEDKYWGSEDEKAEAEGMAAVWTDALDDVKRKRKRVDSQLIEGEKFPRV